MLGGFNSCLPVQSEFVPEACKALHSEVLSKREPGMRSLKCRPVRTLLTAIEYSPSLWACLVKFDRPW